jgi:hypothetical protein
LAAPIIARLVFVCQGKNRRKGKIVASLCGGGFLKVLVDDFDGEKGWSPHGLSNVKYQNPNAN